jgi:RNA recognition motif-containing protein
LFIQSLVQGTVLDGHALILQLCHAKKDEHSVKKAGKDKSSTKLLVRNVAFEATEKDLRQLFGPFGQVIILFQKIGMRAHDSNACSTSLGPRLTNIRGEALLFKQIIVKPCLDFCW